MDYFSPRVKLVGSTNRYRFQVCIAYIQNKDFGVSADFINKGSYELDIAGKKFPVSLWNILPLQ